jgi:hypothetical protein
VGQPGEQDTEFTKRGGVVNGLGLAVAGTRPGAPPRIEIGFNPG